MKRKSSSLIKLTILNLMIVLNDIALAQTAYTITTPDGYMYNCLTDEGEMGIIILVDNNGNGMADEEDNIACSTNYMGLEGVNNREIGPELFKEVTDMSREYLESIKKDESSI